MTCLTVAFLLLATPAAEPPPEAVPLDTEPHGLFVGEQWRYQNQSLLGGFIKRTLADLVSMPTGILGWSWGDWLAFGVITGSTVVMELPFHPSIDVRIQEQLQHSLGPDHPRIWSHYGDVVIWISTFTAFGALLGYGLVTRDDPYLETALLAIEAWLVTQVYVNFIKIWTGREGPMDEQGQGEFHGPKGYFKYSPAGTPSGHAASLWALFTVVMDYWRNPWLDVVLSTIAAVLTVATVTDDYHFASEAILGAGLGIAVGRWVVRHRSSKYRYGHAGTIERVVLAPSIVPGSSYGVALSFAF
jgi:membrane-associated phospholipid phosphatase